MKWLNTWADPAFLEFSLRHPGPYPKWAIRRVRVWKFWMTWKNPLEGLRFTRMKRNIHRLEKKLGSI